ncbi:MAG: zinc ribbon domain-containing protein [Bryobacteraceae bacterium]
MLSDVSRALRLQELDLRGADLNKEIAALPRHTADIERKLESHQRKLDADHAALTGNQKERKKLEIDIQDQEQKISKLRDQMLQVKTNEQYRAFQHEIEFCQKEIRRAEDRILDLMSESEPLEKNVKAADLALAVEKREVEKEKALARQRTDADRRELEQIAQTRGVIVAEMNPGVYASYERIRKARAQALAEALDGRCTACQMSLRPQYLQDLKRGEQVMTCESCGRILFYNPPQSIEDLNSEAAESKPEVRLGMD